jgi:hypothetical protein
VTTHSTPCPSAFTGAPPVPITGAATGWSEEHARDPRDPLVIYELTVNVAVTVCVRPVPVGPWMNPDTRHLPMVPWKRI